MKALILNPKGPWIMFFFLFAALVLLTTGQGCSTLPEIRVQNCEPIGAGMWQCQELPSHSEIHHLGSM